MRGNLIHSRLSPAVLATSWALVLLIFVWLGWRDYQQHIQHHQSLARQAVNTAAQNAGSYFQDVGQRLLQLMEQEAELLETLRFSRDEPHIAGRLATVLNYRFQELAGFALTDEHNNVLVSHPAGHLDPQRRSQVDKQLQATPAPLRIRKHGEGYRFDLVAPWYLGGQLRGALLTTLSCEYLCSSLQTQHPAGHVLTLQPREGNSDADTKTVVAHASLPGTGWVVVDWMDPKLLSDQFLDTLVLRLVPLALFVTATLLLYAGTQRQVRELADKEAHYHSLFEFSALSQLLVESGSGRILDANQPALTFFDRTKTRLQAAGLKKLLNLESNALYANQDLARNGESIQFETQYISPGGETRQLDIGIASIDSPDSNLLLVTICDVTEHSKIMDALRESELKLHAVLDASPDGIVMTNDSGMLQVFSPAAEMMFGYLKEEILGRHFGVLIPSGSYENSNGGLESWVPEGLTAGPGTVRETAGIRKSGEEIPVRVSLNRVTLSGEQHFVALIQDRTESHSNEEKLAYLQRRDVLTGLLNRREFERRLDAVLAFSNHSDTEYMLCHLDVDQFKLVNDTCGHSAGDELLKQLSILVKSQLRETDTVARVGGDEFGALFMDCTLERGERICGALLQTVRNFLFTWRDQSFDVTISIGLTGFRAHAENASHVLSQADVACQMAKHLGGSRLHVYHGGDVDLIRRHGDMHLVSTINQALNEGRFYLYAQPIVPVARHKENHVHYEVLVRMMDEKGRSLDPDGFIPAAERYILMPAIDRWVINRLFTTQAESLRRWADQFPNDGGFLFAINLSGTSLADEGFLSYIKRQFSDHGIPHHAICFEITETAVVANLDRAKGLIEELRDLGCSFALDDFGTGLSSYTYLKILAVDYLKIDGSFVRNMAEDPVDYAMVDSINQIGHILGLKTIAEWAENQSALTQLRALNVDFAQGYAVGETISIDEFRLPD